MAPSASMTPGEIVFVGSGISARLLPTPSPDNGQLHAPRRSRKGHSFVTPAADSTKAPAKHSQFKTRSPRDQQFGQNLPHDTGKFEPVTGARTGDQYLRNSRMPVYEKMAVRRVRVHANDSGAQRSVGVGKKLPYQRAHRFDLLRRHLPMDGVGRNSFALVMPGNLHPFAQVGKAIKVSPRL